MTNKTFYHGSPNYFTSFDTSKIGSTTGMANSGYGINLTDSEAFAMKYTNYNMNPEIGRGYLYKVEVPEEIYKTFLKSNPLISLRGDSPLLEKIKLLLLETGELYNDKFLRTWSESDTYNEFASRLGGANKASQFLLKNGINGVVQGNEYILFDASYAKIVEVNGEPIKKGKLPNLKDRLDYEIITDKNIIADEAQKISVKLVRELSRIGIRKSTSTSEESKHLSEEQKQSILDNKLIWSSISEEIKKDNLHGIMLKNSKGIQSVALYDLKRNRGGSIYIEAIATAPHNISGFENENTSKGFTAKLIAQIIKKEKNEDNEGIVKLTALKQAESFYKHVGFELTQESDYGNKYTLDEEQSQALVEKYGFQKGGYTGKGNPNEIAGVVHKDELVIPSPALNGDLTSLKKQFKTLKEANIVFGTSHKTWNALMEDLKLRYEALKNKPKPEKPKRGRKKKESEQEVITTEVVNPITLEESFDLAGEKLQKLSDSIKATDTSVYEALGEYVSITNKVVSDIIKDSEIYDKSKPYYGIESTEEKKSRILEEKRKKERLKNRDLIKKNTYSDRNVKSDDAESTQRAIESNKDIIQSAKIDTSRLESLNNDSTRTDEKSIPLVQSSIKRNKAPKQQAPITLEESFDVVSKRLEKLATDMVESDRQLYRAIGEYVDGTNKVVENIVEVVQEVKKKKKKSKQVKPQQTSLPALPSSTAKPQRVETFADRIRMSLPHYDKPFISSSRAASPYRMRARGYTPRVRKQLEAAPNKPFLDELPYQRRNDNPIQKLSEEDLIKLEGIEKLIQIGNDAHLRNQGKFYSTGRLKRDEQQPFRPSPVGVSYSYKRRPRKERGGDIIPFESLFDDGIYSTGRVSSGANQPLTPSKVNVRGGRRKNKAKGEPIKRYESPFYQRGGVNQAGSFYDPNREPLLLNGTVSNTNPNGKDVYDAQVIEKKTKRKKKSGFIEKQAKSILDFFLQLFKDFVLYKILRWVGDPQNKDKVEKVVKFVGKVLEFFNFVATGIEKILTLLMPVVTGVLGTIGFVLDSIMLGIKNLPIVGGLFKDDVPKQPSQVTPSPSNSSSFTQPSQQIPKLAKGGLVQSPTMATVGESGKEAIIPLEKLDAFKPQKTKDRSDSGSVGKDLADIMSIPNKIVGASLVSRVSDTVDDNTISNPAIRNIVASFGLPTNILSSTISQRAKIDYKPSTDAKFSNTASSKSVTPAEDKNIFQKAGDSISNAFRGVQKLFNPSASTTGTNSETPSASSTTTETASSEIIPQNSSMLFDAPVLSNFGNRVHPITGVVKHHDGVDYGMPTGTKLPSKIGGIVSMMDDPYGYGNNVIVTNPDGTSIMYAHLSKVLVKSGQRVETGTVVGLSGTSGSSTGPHLHFEVRYKGKLQDPLKFNFSKYQGESTEKKLSDKYSSVLGATKQAATANKNPSLSFGLTSNVPSTIISNNNTNTESITTTMKSAIEMNPLLDTLSGAFGGHNR